MSCCLTLLEALSDEGLWPRRKRAFSLGENNGNLGWRFSLLPTDTGA